MQQQNEKLLETSDFVDKFVTTQSLNRARINHAHINAKNELFLSTEEIQKYVEDYTHYLSQASEFLAKYNFFKQWNHNCMTPDDILTSEAYYKYLEKIIDRLIALASKVSEYRFNPASELHFGHVLHKGSIHSNLLVSYKNSWLLPMMDLNVRFIPATFSFPNQVEQKTK